MSATNDGHRLASAVSPYLRAHADNPVAWHSWGPEAFAEAERRQLPVLVSIGYATCHWCHVMARESFADAELGAWLNERFVAIKVDREEHPEVDSAFMAAAGAFTRNLGWPLNVFTTPAGRPFHAGSYWPPEPRQGMPSFRQVLEAVQDAWQQRREQVEAMAAELVEALAQAADGGLDGAGIAVPDLAAGGAAVDAIGGAGLPDRVQLAETVGRIAAVEDVEHGGFGSRQKFPMAPMLQFLLDEGGQEAYELAERTLLRIAASPLRDAVDGGFFRYATQPDWSEPHYERMLPDNAQLLRAYAGLALRAEEQGRAGAARQAREYAESLAGFLGSGMRVRGGLASAQDSESVVDGRRVEGGYYLADAAGRASLQPPALDAKVITGWNGLAIEALAYAGLRLGRRDWLGAAAALADEAWAGQQPVDTANAAGDRGGVRLARVSLDGRHGEAAATLEDYGLLASGLLQLAEAGMGVRFLERGRALVEAGLAGAVEADPLLAASGLRSDADRSEGDLPSPETAFAAAALRLSRLTAEQRLREVAEQLVARLASRALAQPSAYGPTLSLAAALAAPERQLLVVTAADGAARGDAVQDGAGSAAAGEDGLLAAALGWMRAGSTVAVAAASGIDALVGAGMVLAEGRQEPAAYFCEGFVCRLPVHRAEELLRLLQEETGE